MIVIDDSRENEADSHYGEILEWREIERAGSRFHTRDDAAGGAAVSVARDAEAAASVSHGRVVEFVRIPRFAENCLTSQRGGGPSIETECIPLLFP
jgi:hypothetical protein